MLPPPCDHPRLAVTEDPAEVDAFNKAVEACPNCIDQRPRGIIIDLSNRAGLQNKGLN